MAEIGNSSHPNVPEGLTGFSAAKRLWSAMLTKLDSIIPIKSIKVNGTTQVPASDRSVNITMPAKATWYGTCLTSQNTAAKIVDCQDFELTVGARISVKFAYSCNSSGMSSVTMNVNSTGAIGIKGTHDDLGSSASTLPTQLWRAGQVISFVYDGTYWLMEGINANATTSRPGLMSPADKTKLDNFAMPSVTVTADQFTTGSPYHTIQFTDAQALIIVHAATYEKQIFLDLQSVNYGAWVTHYQIWGGEEQFTAVNVHPERVVEEETIPEYVDAVLMAYDRTTKIGTLKVQKRLVISEEPIPTPV